MCSRDDDPTQHEPERCADCGRKVPLTRDGLGRIVCAECFVPDMNDPAWPGYTGERARLYWDAWGEVACERHAPLRFADAWRIDQWREVPTELRGRAVIACGVCGARAEPVASSTPTAGNL